MKAKRKSAKHKGPTLQDIYDQLMGINNRLHNIELHGECHDQKFEYIKRWLAIEPRLIVKEVAELSARIDRALAALYDEKGFVDKLTEDPRPTKGTHLYNTKGLKPVRWHRYPQLPPEEER
jgi:hypothetical protein